MIIQSDILAKFIPYELVPWDKYLHLTCRDMNRQLGFNIYHNYIPYKYIYLSAGNFGLLANHDGGGHLESGLRRLRHAYRSVTLRRRYIARNIPQRQPRHGIVTIATIIIAFPYHAVL